MEHTSEEEYANKLASVLLVALVVIIVLTLARILVEV